MQGNILYPLNQLKSIFPEIYKKEVEKYNGREEILKLKIPKLNCQWNDVLHFTTVNPSEIKKTLEQIGFEPPRRKWYKINPNSLEKDKTTIYLYKYNRNNENYMTEKDFIEYSPSKLKRYSKISKRTLDYYKEMLAQDKKPLLFVYVPHILYKANTNISKLETITI